MFLQKIFFMWMKGLPACMHVHEGPFKSELLELGLQVVVSYVFWKPTQVSVGVACAVNKCYIVTTIMTHQSFEILNAFFLSLSNTLHCSLASISCIPTSRRPVVLHSKWRKSCSICLSVPGLVLLHFNIEASSSMNDIVNIITAITLPVNVEYYSIMYL